MSTFHMMDVALNYASCLYPAFFG